VASKTIKQGRTSAESLTVASHIPASQITHASHWYLAPVPRILPPRASHLALYPRPWPTAVFSLMGWTTDDGCYQQTATVTLCWQHRMVQQQIWDNLNASSIRGAMPTFLVVPKWHLITLFPTLNIQKQITWKSYENWYTQRKLDMLPFQYTANINKISNLNKSLTVWHHSVTISYHHNVDIEIHIGQLV